MSRKSPLIIEVVIGVILSGLIAWAFITRWYPVESFSLKTYDIFSKFSQKSAPAEDIVIIGIDEESVNKLGRWPWPRPLVGTLIDEVAARGAKVIGLNIAYLEPDQNLGLEEISNLQSSFQELMAKYQRLFKAKKIPTKDLNEFMITLTEAKENMNGDAALGLSIEQGGSVVIPMEFVEGEPLGDNLEPLPDYILNQKLSLAGTDQTFPQVPSALSGTPPIEPVARGAMAIGFNTFFRDLDGSLRRVAPVMRYGTLFFPSFGIQVLRNYLNLQPEAVKWEPAEGLRMFKAQIPLDDEGKTYVKFVGPAGSFKYFSALELFMGSVPDDAFEKKIALVGVNLSGLSELFITPGGEAMTGLEIWANHLTNILNQDFITRPVWADKAELLGILLAAMVVMLVLPFLRARFAIPISAVVFGALIGASLFAFIKRGLWVSPTYGAVLLASGFAILVAKRYLLTEKGKEMVEAEGVETNKMLGLSFQGQGMLDLAFEKFRKCPVDGQMKDLLYNLGLDMERKRQFTKAAAVFEHISAVDPKYKDIQDKIQLLKKAGEGAVFGGVGKKGSEATVVVDGLGQNTTLGRYEVLKELGRGAMGIVYLGRDPKINRQVAIKTLRFEDEVSEEQMKSIKERFFREAESAGNLTHPNIIRIFDAGEDQDVAYIAMELLEGHDLKACCEKGHLLPIPKVIEYIATVADALDYAHKQGVVHRDIKPANIMLLKDNSIRITDFGIARIQTSSKTATGAVLGTPAYMSPEQVNGQKADGRSDLYSLGVTLYEMLSGEKPFQADTIAALLYRIANVDHPNPKEHNPQIPQCVIEVLNKALAKKPEDRYQTGQDMARDLKNCLKQVGGEAGASIDPARSTQNAPSSITSPAKSTPPPPTPTANNFESLSLNSVKPATNKAMEPPVSKPDVIIEDKPQESREMDSVDIPADEASHSELIGELQETFNIKNDLSEFFQSPATNNAASKPATNEPAAPRKPVDSPPVIDGIEGNGPPVIPQEIAPTPSPATAKKNPGGRPDNPVAPHGTNTASFAQDKTAAPPKEKDVKNIIEKTVIDAPPPKLKSEDIPTLNNIEHNFHPDNIQKKPESSDDKQKPNNKWEL